MQNVDLALEELNKALAIKPDYVDAIYLKRYLLLIHLYVYMLHRLEIFVRPRSQIQIGRTNRIRTKV